MSSTARKDRRHLWWKHHGKQVSDDKDDEEVERPTKFKKPSYKRNLNDNKEQQESSAVSTSTESTDLKKARFIAFVGNLPFDLTKDDIIDHFRCTGGVTDFRLMTKKDGGTSKGCGFLELENFVCYEKALTLHHSVIKGRKINVEITCGGGGSGEKRLEKLNAKKKKFRQKRRKKIKSEKKEEKDQSEENETQKHVVKTEGKQSANKEKKRKRKHEPLQEQEKKKKKKSLKDSSVMESIVKDLELESLVVKKEKQIED